MAGKKRAKGPSVLTANEIMTGLIVFWDGSAWVEGIDTALRASPEEDAAREALEATGRSEEAANRVVGAYLVVLDPVTDEPIELRERRRLAGPSIALPTFQRAA